MAKLIRKIDNATGAEYAGKVKADELEAGIQDKNFVFEQITASNVWTIGHPLQKKPAVTVIDSAGTEMLGDVKMLDENTIQIRFKFPFSGTAILN